MVPQTSVKILGVVMDEELRYKELMTRTATRGLRAAMAPRRLRAVPLKVARQVLTATVTPIIDYASSVWKNTCNHTTTKDPTERRE